MRCLRNAAALMTAFGCVSFASIPVANLSSNQAILLDGHALAAAGVSSWPMVLGDDITTATSPATISFPDGSTIKLDPMSRAKISGTTAQPRVTLVAGKMDYRLAPGSELTLANGDQPPANTDQDQATTGAAKPTVIQNHSKKFFFLLGSLIAAAVIGAAFLAYVFAGVAGTTPGTPSGIGL